MAPELVLGAVLRVHGVTVENTSEWRVRKVQRGCQECVNTECTSRLSNKCNLCRITAKGVDVTLDPIDGGMLI